MSNPHHLLNLVVCPRTKSELEYVKFGSHSGLLSRKDGVLYPLIEGVVVMQPVTPQIKTMCRDFFEENSISLAGLKPFYSPEKTRQVLLSPPDIKTQDWREEEMEYWEQGFQSRLDSEKSKHPVWNRIMPRKMLLERLSENLSGRIVLEVGCGASRTFFDIYGEDIPNYIGLDLSYYACRLSKKRYPHGLFIQASAENLPFRKNSIDCLLAYGLLHHLPSHEKNICNFLPLLKPGGYLIGCDPLKKPALPLLKSKKSLSPHNDWIDWKNLLFLLRERAENIESFFEYGPLRALLVKVFCDGKGINSRKFVTLMIGLDRLWLKTMGKLHPTLGPAGVHYLIKKRGT